MNEHEIADGVVVESPEAPVEEAPQDTTDLHEVALEVIAGRWGRGQNRRRRLVAAGHNPDEVALEIAKVMNQ